MPRKSLGQSWILDLGCLGALNEALKLQAGPKLIKNLGEGRVGPEYLRQFGVTLELSSTLTPSPPPASKIKNPRLPQDFSGQSLILDLGMPGSFKLFQTLQAGPNFLTYLVTPIAGMWHVLYNRPSEFYDFLD